MSGSSIRTPEEISAELHDPIVMAAAYKALLAAWMRGASRVKYATSPGMFDEVQFQSRADMERVLRWLERKLGAEPARAGYFLAGFDKRR